jgi:hypothetical protein
MKRAMERKMGIRRTVASLSVLMLGVMTLPSVAFAALLSGGAARMLTERGGIIEQVQYRRSRYRMSPELRERYVRTWLDRTVVQTEGDDTFLIPGMENDHRGRTIITGAPRSRTLTGSRLGVPSRGTGNRLTGGVPGVHRRR